MPPEPLPWIGRSCLGIENIIANLELLQDGEIPLLLRLMLDLATTHQQRFFSSLGFPSPDFRRPHGHGKQGGWHMYPEDHGYPTPRSNDRFLDDDVFRPSGMRGDGRYGRPYRENRPSFVQKDWRGHSWEPNHHHSASANGVGRPRVNDQKPVGDSPMRASHPYSDPCDQLQSKDQAEKMSDANGSGTCQKGDKEKMVGSLDWKPLKWSRSGSLTSRGSGFSHSSSSKSMGGESSDLPPKNATPIQSPSGDAVGCVPSAVPSDETSSRKKPRLGWGEGLAKYEKKKVDGPEDDVHKAGNATLVCNVEPAHSLPSNLVNKSPKLTGFSDCSSPATPSSFACSSSPGLEDKAYGKTVDADGDASNFSVSSMPVPEIQPAQSHFSLEKLELKSISNLGSLLTELLQADDHSHHPASSNSGPADFKDGPSNGLNIFPRPQPLEVVSSGDIILEDRLPCDDARGVHAENKDEDIDSPGTATSKFVEPPVQKSVTPEICKNSSGQTGFIESTKSTTDNLATHIDETNVGTCIQGHDRNVVQVDNSIAVGIDNLESANTAAEVLLKLLPSCDYSTEANRVSSLPPDTSVRERFLKRKRFLKFKERVISLKYRAFHHLWKEDLRLLSLRSHRSKPQKKLELSSRALQTGSQKHRSSIRSRFASPAGSLSLVPTAEIINFTDKLLSDSQVKVYRSSLKMPAMILDDREKKSRFVSSNGLVEDPFAVEKERALINPWTAEEKEIFMDKLATHGKDFRMIASFLDHKTTADCVEFYYKNHKSDCFQKIKKPELKRLEKPLSSSTYLLTSGKKWSREMNAASLDILGAASVIAAEADQALETSKLLVGKSCNKKSRGSDGIVEASSSMYGAEDERETAAADVLAGICGSLSSEAMSSCITSSVDPGEGNQDRKHQKIGSSIKRPLTPEVTQNVDDDTCSEESCGEMDPVDWTDEEKSLFVRAFSSHGKDFLMISQCVRTKSRDQCKVFFSKSRKCLGLDISQSGSGSGGIHASNDTNEGGSDNEDAGIVETGSAVCSDKSGSRMDEDLLHVNQDVSKPESAIAELNMTEDSCGPAQLDNTSAGFKVEGLLPHDHRANASDAMVIEGVVDVQDKDKDAVKLTFQDEKYKMNRTIDKSVPGTRPVSAYGTSDSKSEVLLSSVPIEYSSPVDGLSKPSVAGDKSVHHLQSGVFMMNRVEIARDFKGFPLDLSMKADLHDVVTHSVGSEGIGHSFPKSYLRRCSRTASHSSGAELPLLQQSGEDDLWSSCSSKSEKPCRNGDVKLFGKILSKPSNIPVHDEKAKNHSSCSSSKFDAKLAANQDDHNSFLGLENVPIRSYGFWDGTKIQTGLSSLPDSALLLAKYPGAFSNMSVSSSKSEQHPCQILP
ncbi:Nuclear receptor corepressor 1 [Bienertia sinuspersici]